MKELLKVGDIVVHANIHYGKVTNTTLKALVISRNAETAKLVPLNQNLTIAKNAYKFRRVSTNLRKLEVEEVV